MLKTIKLPRDHLLVNAFRFEGGDKLGSGFVVRHDVPQKGRQYFLVTNRHVVSGVESGECLFAACKGNPPYNCVLDGAKTIKVLRDPQRGWFGHPKPEIDVAIYRMGQDQHFHNDLIGGLSYAVIDTGIFANESPEVDLCDAVLFVGYPAGRVDAKNPTPVFRAGAVASPPALDWNGRRSFLIDASVFPGSSGSPVFVPKDKMNMTFEGMHFDLLGMVTRTMAYNSDAKLVDATVPVNASEAFALRNYLDLGVVTKVVCIREAINAVLANTAPLIT